jgi:hypothetical protein
MALFFMVVPQFVMYYIIVYYRTINWHAIDIGVCASFSKYVMTIEPDDLGDRAVELLQNAKTAHQDELQQLQGLANQGRAAAVANQQLLPQAQTQLQQQLQQQGAQAQTQLQQQLQQQGVQQQQQLQLQQQLRQQMQQNFASSAAFDLNDAQAKAEKEFFKKNRANA